MSHAYTEDQLVEQPAIGLFAALGWQTISALEETFGTAGTLGRETKSEVLLVERLRIALTKLGDSPHVFISVTAGRKPHRRRCPRPAQGWLRWPWPRRAQAAVRSPESAESQRSPRPQPAAAGEVV